MDLDTHTRVGPADRWAELLVVLASGVALLFVRGSDVPSQIGPWLVVRGQ